MSDELERTPYTTAELAAIVQRAEALVPVNDSAAFSLICQFRIDVPRLAAEVIALRKALEPFAKAFAHRVAAPALSEARRKHYTNMPGEWSITLTVTMQDGRNACALLPPEPS